MSIPEVLSSHLTPSRQFGSLPFIPVRRGFSCSPCHFRWERLRRQQIRPAAPATRSSRCVVTASTWEKRANAQRKLQEAPPSVRVWSVIPTAKMRERRGELLEDNFQQGSMQEASNENKFPKRHACSKIWTRTPITSVMSPLAMLQRSSSKGGEGGPMYGLVTPQLFLWLFETTGLGRGQTMSTLPSTFHLQEWLKVESSFWHRGVFSLAYSHLKSGLHLSVEVEED